MGRLAADQYDHLTQVAAGPPTSSDDSTQGFELGHEWLDSVTQTVWKLVAEPSPGNAVWKDSTQTASSLHPVTITTVDPTITDDSGSGFAVGDHWVNTATPAAFQAMNVSVGAAVWQLLGPAQIRRKVISNIIVPAFRVELQRHPIVEPDACILVEPDGELLAL